MGFWASNQPNIDCIGPRPLQAKFGPSILAPRHLQRKLAPSILPPEMYSTARQTTLVDYNQRHSPSTTSKSSLQLIHSRRIVSISLFAKNHHFHNRCRRIRTISGRHLSSHSSESSSDYENPFSCDSTHNDFVLPPGKLLSRNVTWIGVATITSKVLGLLREIVIASAFGIGPVVTAFRYASVLPGFAASVLGGVNGPIHITMTTTLRLVAISVSATFLIAKAEFRVFCTLTATELCLPGAKGTIFLLSPYSSKTAGSSSGLDLGDQQVWELWREGNSSKLECPISQPAAIIQKITDSLENTFLTSDLLIEKNISLLLFLIDTGKNIKKTFLASHLSQLMIFSKLPEDRQKKLFKHANTIMILVGGLLAALVLIYSESIIHIYAPGLWTSAEGQTTSRIAIQQLKLMTPCIVLAGPVGLGFGYMSAKGENVFPAISPTLSSLLLIASCLIYSYSRQLDAFCSGGILLSCGASLGVVIQWIIQVLLLRGTWHEVISESWTDELKSGDIYDVHLFDLPLRFTFISISLAQIASFTDLCFASHFAGAAAGLSYAFLLVMAPLGLLSSIVILPLLPTFSGLIKTESWPTLVEKINRGVLLCMVVLLPIISVMSSLADPIIRVLFERYAFDSSASALVSSLYLFYSLGSPFLIVRELVVAVFYAFGDGLRPFLVSIGAIALNAILDWFFVHRLHIGVQGLALSTSLTAALSLITLIHLLRRKVGGLFLLHELISPGLFLCFCCVISSFVSSFSYENISKIFLSEFITRLSRIQELYCIVSAAALGIIGFFAPLVVKHLKINIFWQCSLLLPDFAALADESTTVPCLLLVLPLLKMDTSTTRIRRFARINL
ncbi:hypothetical protein MTR67_010972 [Solanum verrucosum]|uniref:Lipid II flippase MurJ n=1 Tax=Solanum verrucosum TaxID=315347 RepID=A0AAF0TEN8_SOLVR|nr:hypothetical protein MTR67_010972 [Solanum verrucosum]